MEPTHKKASKRTVVSAAVWAVTYLISVYILKHTSLAKPVALSIAVVPIVLFAVFIYCYITGIAALDEVKQRIQFEAVALGFALGLLMLMVLFLLDMAQVLSYDYFGYVHLVLYFIFFYYVGFFIAKRKYTA
jgi:hypothetical protein